MLPFEIECEVGPCRRRAKWLPALMVPSSPLLALAEGRANRLLMEIAVCDLCRMRSTPTTLLSPQQRGQVEKVFELREIAPPHWPGAYFDWLDLAADEARVPVNAIIERQRALKERH